MSKRKRAGSSVSNRRQNFLMEQLEVRTLLSGAHDQVLLNALEAALQAGNTSGLVGFNSRLKDSSALGKDLAIVGTAMDYFDPGATLSGALTPITGTYASLAGLADSLATGHGVTVPASRDLPDDLQIDVQFNLAANIYVPITNLPGVNFSDPLGMSIAVTLSETLTVGAYWDPVTSAAGGVREFGK